MNEKPLAERIKLAVVSSETHPDVVDPFPALVNAPAYPYGILPSSWEERGRMFCRVYGSFHEYYAAPFLAVCSSVLHASVKVQLRESDPNSFTPFVDQVLAVGESGTTKTKVQEELLRTLHKREVELGNAQREFNRQLKEGSKTPPTKVLVYTNATVETMAFTSAVNEGLPLTLAPTEAGEGLISPGSHRADALSSLADAYRAGWDGAAYSHGRKSSGSIYVEAMRLNTVLSVTSDDLVAWSGFEAACSNGMLGRMSLYTGSKRSDRATGATVISGVVDRVEKVLSEFYRLRYTKCRLPPGSDESLALYEKAQLESAARHMSSNPGYGTYLRKNAIRLVRWAGALALWELIDGIDLTLKRIDAADKVGGDAVQVQPRHLAAAVQMLEWLNAQQLHIYNNLLFQDAIGREVQNITYTILCDGLTAVSRDQMVSKGTGQMRKWNTGVWSTKEKCDEVIRRLLDYNILLTDPDARNAQPTKPEMAGRFKVNPKTHRQLAFRKMEAIADVENRRAAISAAFAWGQKS